MNFFKYFPTVGYNFQEANTAFALNVVNTTAHIRLVTALKKNITVLYDYQIQEAERPDTVSVNLYGSPNYTWIILVLNQIFSLFDWPLTSEEFNKYIIERYGSVTAARSLFLYKTADGYFVDLTTWTALNADQRQDPIAVYDNELDLNEAKRRIQVVPAGFVSALDIELRKILAS